jgi:hypothetical protein
MAILIMVIVLNAVIYLTAAFMMWQLNPAHWDGFIRFLVAFMSVMLDVLLIGAYIEWKAEK